MFWSVPAFVLLTVLEVVSYRFHPDDDEVGYGGKDTATSLSMGLGSLGFDLLWRLPAAAVYSASTRSPRCGSVLLVARR